MTRPLFILLTLTALTTACAPVEPAPVDEIDATLGAPRPRRDDDTASIDTASIDTASIDTANPSKLGDSGGSDEE